MPRTSESELGVLIPGGLVNRINRYHEKYVDESGETQLREFDVAVLEPGRLDLLPFDPAWRLDLGGVIVAVSRPVG